MFGVHCADQPRGAPLEKSSSSRKIDEINSRLASSPRGRASAAFRNFGGSSRRRVSLTCILHIVTPSFCWKLRVTLHRVWRRRDCRPSRPIPSLARPRLASLTATLNFNDGHPQRFGTEFFDVDAGNGARRFWDYETAETKRFLFQALRACRERG